MGKRRKGVRSERVSYRWPADVVAVVDELVQRTGWSDAKAAAFLVRAGGCYLASRASGKDSLRYEVEAAATVHAATTKAGELVKVARAKARAMLPKSQRVEDAGVLGA